MREPLHMSKPLQAIIVGAGHRALTYASYALSHPGQLQIVGVADPNSATNRPRPSLRCPSALTSSLMARWITSTYRLRFRY